MSSEYRLLDTLAPRVPAAEPASPASLHSTRFARPPQLHELSFLCFRSASPMASSPTHRLRLLRISRNGEADTPHSACFAARFARGIPCPLGGNGIFLSQVKADGSPLPRYCFSVRRVSSVTSSLAQPEPETTRGLLRPLRGSASPRASRRKLRFLRRMWTANPHLTFLAADAATL